jgi:hypothetical protein
MEDVRSYGAVENIQTLKKNPQLTQTVQIMNVVTGGGAPDRRSAGGSPAGSAEGATRRRRKRSMS